MRTTIVNLLRLRRRVRRTAETFGIRTTTLYTDPDATSQHALSSPFSVNLGDPKAYLDGNAIIRVAKEQGCDSVHPGYGFVRKRNYSTRRMYNDLCIALE